MGPKMDPWGAPRWSGRVFGHPNAFVWFVGIYGENLSQIGPILIFGSQDPAAGTQNIDLGPSRGRAITRATKHID